MHLKLILFIFSSTLFACLTIARAREETLLLKKGESDIEFAERITSHSLTHTEDQEKQIARTKKLVPDKEVLIAFVEIPSEPASDSTFDIDLYLFTKKSETSYSQTSIQACEVEGGSPSLRSFFYLNVDLDTDLEIAVICGWDAVHSAADCQAKDEVRFFKFKNDKLEAIPMEKFERILYSRSKPDKKATYECMHAKFKSAADVKKLMK